MDEPTLAKVPTTASPGKFDLATERALLRRTMNGLHQRLPAGWAIEDVPPPLSLRPHTTVRPDAIWQLTAPDGQQAIFVIEAKLNASINGRQAQHAESVLRPAVAALRQMGQNAQGLFVSWFLPPVIREQLTAAGLSYSDATGNMRIVSDAPAVLLNDQGAANNPWRGPGRPRQGLKGEPAARVVRAIADFPFTPDWQTTGLLQLAGVSPGAGYRVLGFLEEEGLITRQKRGSITVPSWSAILRRWSKDYGFLRSNVCTRWVAPRGLPKLMERVAATEGDLRYAVTGTFAAQQWHSIASARAAMIYVSDTSIAARSWGLHPAETGANVLLAEPATDLPFTRPLIGDLNEVMYASPTQVAVDLLTGPGRNPSEGEELLEWMEKNESSWGR